MLWIIGGKLVDNTSENDTFQSVSPYLQRPVRNLREAQLASVVRKARAEAWSLGVAGPDSTAQAIRAILERFPDMTAPEALAAFGVVQDS